MATGNDPQSNGLWKQIVDIRPAEWPQALLMAGYFFLVITTFWILKPLKKTQFVEFYDTSGFELLTWTFSAAQAEQFAKVLNMVVALFAAMAFASLSRRFRREKLTYVFCTFLVLCFAAFTPLFEAPGPGTVWSFYLFGDLYNTLMVASFFAFLNDSVTADGAKRLYGLIVLGAVGGGAFGTTILSAYIDDLSVPEWLWISAGIAVVIAVFAGAAGARFRSSGDVAEQVAPDKSSRLESGKKASALDGARMVFRSRYLLSIALILGLYEMVSALMDFQFTSAVAHFLDGEEIGAHFAFVYAITNWVAFFVQLFLTSLVMRRFGIGVALLVLPAAALLSSGGFLVMPVLLTGSALLVSDNALNYSINQSAREALYVPTTREEKYQAKAFIDMFVQRFAKALAVGLSLGVTTFISGFEGVRWLSLLTLVILIVWIRVAWFAGKEFDRLTSDDEIG